MLGRREARVAAGFFAILPGPLYMTGLFLSETIFIFELVGFLALPGLPAGPRPGSPPLLGLALGIAALTRGEGFLMVAIPLAAWWPLRGAPGLADALGGPDRGDAPDRWRPGRSATPRGDGCLHPGL